MWSQATAHPAVFPSRPGSSGRRHGDANIEVSLGGKGGLEKRAAEGQALEGKGQAPADWPVGIITPIWLSEERNPITCPKEEVRLAPRCKVITAKLPGMDS